MTTNGTKRTAEQIEELKNRAKKLEGPQAQLTHLREAALYATVRLRDEMEQAPDTKTFRECSKELREWGAVLLKTIGRGKKASK